MRYSEVVHRSTIPWHALGSAVLVCWQWAGVGPAVAAEPAAATSLKAIREQLDTSVRLLDAGDRDSATVVANRAIATLAEIAALPRRPAAFAPLANRAAGVRRRFEKAGIELATVAVPGPAKAPATAAAPQRAGRAAISFSREVAPILNRSCGGCHVAGRKGDFQMASYQGLMRSGMVQAGAGASSRLIEVILTGDMPRGGGRIPAADVETLTKWIDAGAACDAAAAMIPIDVLARGGGGPPQPQSPPEPQAVELGPGRVSFAIDVAPTLATHCLRCHGGDETEGGFSMATLETLLRGGGRGVAVVSGTGSQSLLVRKLKGVEIEGQRMPLNAPPLPQETIAIIERWIDEGARLDMLTGKSPLDVLVAAGRTRSLTDSGLADLRVAAAEKAWRRAIPDERPVVARRPGVCLVGNLPPERMAALADLAERSAAEVRRDLGLERPLLKGDIVLYLADKGYDYSTLWQTMLNAERPRGMTSHFGLDGEIVYGALLAPVTDGTGDADAALTEAVVAAAFAGRSVPDWFARGAGRAVASRRCREAPLVRTWRAAAGPAAAAIPAADLLGGTAVDAVAAAALAGGVMGAIGTGPRLCRMLEQLDEGVAFEVAFARTFNATPREACAAWAVKAAQRP